MKPDRSLLARATVGAMEISLWNRGRSFYLTLLENGEVTEFDGELLVVGDYLFCIYIPEQRKSDLHEPITTALKLMGYEDKTELVYCR